LETLATVLHLITTPSDLQRFKNDKLELKVILSSAKKVLPAFGSLYGFFSESFIHISSLHGRLQPVALYNKHSDELNANIRFLRMSVWLIYVVVELLFIDLIDERKYWKSVEPGQAAYQPSEETLQWQAKFLKAEISPLVAGER